MATLSAIFLVSKMGTFGKSALFRTTKYGPYDFYFMNLSLLGAILAIFQFFDFRACFGNFSHVKKGKYKMPKKQQKMASNKKMQENKPTLEFNFT